jgi:P22 tail accessory factor
MSITCIEMLTDAYRAANIIDESETPSAEMGATGIRVLNQMLGEWDEDGIKLGWQVVAAQSDTLPIRYQDERAVKYNLAVELAGEFEIDVLPRVQRIADRTYGRLAKAHRLKVESSLELLPNEAAGPFTGSINDGGF